jgi:hypothetical protein
LSLGGRDARRPPPCLTLPGGERALKRFAGLLVGIEAAAVALCFAALGRFLGIYVTAKITRQSAPASEQ